MVEGDTITIDGLYVDGQGRVSRDRRSGPREQGEELARRLAETLKGGCLCPGK